MNRTLNITESRVASALAKQGGSVESAEEAKATGSPANTFPKYDIRIGILTDKMPEYYGLFQKAIADSSENSGAEERLRHVLWPVHPYIRWLCDLLDWFRQLEREHPQAAKECNLQWILQATERATITYRQKLLSEHQKRVEQSPPQECTTPLEMWDF